MRDLRLFSWSKVLAYGVAVGALLGGGACTCGSNLFNLVSVEGLPTCPEPLAARAMYLKRPLLLRLHRDGYEFSSVYQGFERYDNGPQGRSMPFVYDRAGTYTLTVHLCPTLKSRGEEPDEAACKAEQSWSQTIELPYEDRVGSDGAVIRRRVPLEVPKDALPAGAFECVEYK